MRRLHLRLYLTIVGTLVAFAISAPMLWHFVAWPQGAAWSIETATHLSASMLDEVHAPALDQTIVDTLAGQLHADVVLLDEDPQGGVAVDGLLAVLGSRDVQGVVVEGGATLAWSFVREGLVDRVVWYVAPKLVGGVAAPGALGGDGFAPIAEACELAFSAIERVGADLRLEAYVHRDR